MRLGRAAVGPGMRDAVMRQGDQLQRGHQCVREEPVRWERMRLGRAAVEQANITFYYH